MGLKGKKARKQIRKRKREIKIVSHYMGDQPDPFKIVEGTLCVRCKERKASVTFVGSGSVMEYIHGMGQPYCNTCVAREQIDWCASNLSIYIFVRIGSYIKHWWRND